MLPQFFLELLSDLGAWLWEQLSISLPKDLLGGAGMMQGIWGEGATHTTSMVPAVTQRDSGPSLTCCAVAQRV